MKYFNDFLMPQCPSKLRARRFLSLYFLAGESRNSEVRVRIRSEMEQKMGGTIGKLVLVTKIRQA
jgi:hypothetical protein